MGAGKKDPEGNIKRKGMLVGSFWLRFALFLVVLPFFYMLIFLLPAHHHLVFNLGVVLATVGASLEVESLFRKKGVPVPRYIFPIFSGIFPLTAYLQVAAVLPAGLSPPLNTGLIALALLSSLWLRRPGDLESSLSVVASSLFILFYPALFMAYIVRLTGLHNPSFTLLLFFSMVFLNDIMAYLAGKFLGQKSKLQLPISPNKTGLGFIAGFASSIACALVYKVLFPTYFSVGFLRVGLFGALIGLVTILGDLVESALKRSAGVKDSSRVIPGRGGLLDSMDSWLFSAPVFYFVIMHISG